MYKSLTILMALLGLLAPGVSTASALTSSPPRVVQLQSEATSIALGITDVSVDDPLQSVAVQYRALGATSWSALPDFKAETTLTGLTASTAYELQADFRLTSGTTGWLSQQNIYTSGLKPMQVSVVDSVGKPATGGELSWASVDGSFRSAQSYGLTSNGLAEFPRVPASPIRIRYSGVRDSSGNFYVGSVSVNGGSTVSIKLPLAPSNSKYNIKLVLPNGLSVAGAPVEASGLARVQLFDMSGQPAVFPGINGFENRSCVRTTGAFQSETCGKVPGGYSGLIASPGLGAGLTDGSGQIQLAGHPKGAQATVRATYNDGILIQSKVVSLTSSNITIVFEEMPWLSLADQEQFARLGAVVSVPITFEDSLAPAPVTALNLVTSVVQAQQVRTLKSRSGIQVSIIPPTGARQNCAKKLSGATDAKGKVVLKICATKSGEYKIQGRGAVPTSSLMLLVKGAPPMPITAFSATLPKPGTAKLAWNPPFYSGGASVKYEVVVSGGGHLVKKIVQGRTLVVSGFKNGTQVRADITPITKFGRGDVTQRSFFIA